MPGSPPRPRAPPPAEEDWSGRFEVPLPVEFYDRSTEAVARELLGAVLLGRRRRRWVAAQIVETEAYVSSDEASHAYRGPTARNRSMFAGPGRLYVFRIHQVHCANAVTRSGEAVLLRAGEPLLRPAPPMNGPGRLAAAFGLTLRQDGDDLVTGPLRIVPGVAPVERVITLPRVGLGKARDRPLRFVLFGNPWVSRPRPWRSRRAGRFSGSWPSRIRASGP
jgi:DNA-3-methyladenine glycosylase